MKPRRIMVGFLVTFIALLVVSVLVQPAGAWIVQP